LFGAGTTIASLMTPPAAMALLVFCLLYTPCVATISTVHHEMGSRYAFVLVLWQCMVAWICAFVVHALFSLFF
jgi:ferrous iron transport protein B